MRICCLLSIAFVGLAATASGKTSASRCSERENVYPKAGQLRGDVDGDGVIDRVRITSQRAGSHCVWRIVVTSARTRMVLRLAQPSASAHWGTDSRFPRLERLVNIDRHPGREIVLSVDGGASTTGFAIVSVRRSNLVRLRVRPSGELPDTFISGGSLAGDNEFGCLAPGRIAQTARGQDGNYYSGERAIYQLQGTTFHYVKTNRFRHLTRRQLRKFPESRQHRYAACRSGRAR